MKYNQPLLLLTILLLGSLVISIILNFIIYNRAKQYYIQLNKTSLDPLGLSLYPPKSNQPKPEISDRQRVVFFGDSRIHSWPSPNLPNYEFINRGIGGHTSEQIIQRFEAHIRPLQPDIVVLQLGINDLKTLGLFSEKKADIIANCRKNLGKIVKSSQELGAVVIISTIFPFGEIPLARKAFWSDDIFPAVQEMNAYISTLAEEGVIIFDAFSILADNQGMMPLEYRVDELHYNQRGYEKLNQELSELLRKLK